MSNFFDLDDNNFTSNSGSGGSARKEDEDLYNPDPGKHNGSYKSVIRFIPYIRDKKLSKYTKYIAKFYNPLTKEAFWVDCPSNWGAPSILWDAATVIRGLEKEEPDLYNKYKQRFSRWFNHHSPVYIRKDSQRPDLEGSVKIFKYAKQVDDFIEAELNPEEEELLESTEKVNPFHLLKGKDFMCIVSKKTKEWRNWTKCKFSSDITPFIFKIGDKPVKVSDNEKSIELVTKFLEKNTPDMSKYMHVEWDDKTRKSVAEWFISRIDNRSLLNLILDKTKDSDTKELILSMLNNSSGSKSTNTESDELLDEMDDELEFDDNTTEDIGDPLEEKDESSASEEKDEYDELFEEL